MGGMRVGRVEEQLVVREKGFARSKAVGLRHIGHAASRPVGAAITEAGRSGSRVCGAPRPTSQRNDAGVNGEASPQRRGPC